MSRYDVDDDDRVVVIEQHSAGVTPFLVGMALGAGLALLFAPSSGTETRRQIRKRALRVRRAAEQVATDVTDSVSETFHEARRRVEERIDSARDALDLKRRQVQRAVEAGRAAAHDAREELEQRIAETKAAYNGPAAAERARGAAVGDDETSGD
jgi:gas vesicle protein